MKKSRLARWAAAAALLMSAMTAAHANLVVNGDFETGNFTGWSKSGNLSLSDVISNTVTSNHTYVWRSGATGSPALISQTLSTMAGGAYTLSFDVYNSATSNMSFEALFDGVSVLAFSNTAYNWAHFSFSGLNATSASTVLSFSARNDPSFLRLDNVVVTADVATDDGTLPEPGSVVLVLSALGLAALAQRRRA